MTSAPATTPSPTAETAAPPRAGGILALVNFLIPGLGYFIVGRNVRGLLQSGMVFLTMAIGFALHGGVAWPSWSPQTMDFNLINNFTFIVQLGGGLPAFASLVGGIQGWPVLGGIPQHAYYELGAYYLVVAGAINYFASFNFYDRVVRVDSRYREQENESGEGLI